MLLCYLDESGDEAPLRTATDPPVFVLGGVVVDADRVDALIRDFLELKQQFNPSLRSDRYEFTDRISFEVKGSNLRSDLRSSSRNSRRRAVGFLDQVVDLLELHGKQITAEVHVKGGTALGRWVYSRSVSQLAERFEVRLRSRDDQGLIVLDSRTKAKNVPSVAGVTTRRFSADGALRHLLESPVFGHSDAHVLLQLADLVVSALLFPLACAAFCLCLLDNVHPSEQYLAVQQRYGERVRLLQRDPDGALTEGVRVVDHVDRRPTHTLFAPSAVAAR